MRWDFDGAGEWRAWSDRMDSDDVCHLEWRIQVCDDGTFSVNASDPELTERKETFPTLQAAKDFCQQLEGKVLVITADKVSTLIPQEENMIVDGVPVVGSLCTPAVQQSIEAWFNKRVH
jgi:hypothetical protein